MKLAFSTNAYTRYSLHDALNGIAAAGYKAVEILADRPHAYPVSSNRPFVEFIIGQLDRLGLSVSNVNANCTFGYWLDAPPEAFFEPSIISPNPRHREDRIAMILATLNFARDVGAKNISITSGKLLGGMPPQKAADVFQHSMEIILQHAQRVGVNVGIECEPGLYLEYAEELRQWIDRIGHPRLGANLDIGHSQVIGESIPQVVKLLGDRIWNLHVEDISGRKHYHMIPGEGTLNWGDLKAALAELNYQRYATVELYTQTADPQSAAEKSFVFLSKALN